MAIIAEFTDEDTALEGHKALIDQGISPESIDVRSAYPMPDEALPPHRSHPMRMRNQVRLLWVLGALAGFLFIAYTQVWWWPLRTGGHPLVPLPMDLILTYECGMITALISTIVLLYRDTRRYRNLNPPAQEDLPIQQGNIAIVVDGHDADKAEKILKSKGAYTIVKLSVLFLLFLPFLSGCAVKMRDEPYIKSTETSQIPTPPGTLSMPTRKEQTYPVTPFGYFHPPQMRMLDKKTLTVPPAFMTLKDPIPADDASVARGKVVFEHNCIFCHGPGAEGNGKVGELFMPQPANLMADKVKQEPNGALFYKITIGPSTMPSFANRLNTREIFDVIHYVRSLQQHKNR